MDFLERKSALRHLNQWINYGGANLKVHAFRRRAMREMALPVEHGIGGATLLDPCGTGGDGGHF